MKARGTQARTICTGGPGCRGLDRIEGAAIITHAHVFKVRIEGAPPSIQPKAVETHAWVFLPTAAASCRVVGIATGWKHCLTDDGRMPRCQFSEYHDFTGSTCLTACQ